MAQACAVGLITGCGAILYDGLIHLVQWLALTSQDHPLHVLPDLPWYQILLAPALGGLAVGLVGFFRSQDATGHGVPDPNSPFHQADYLVLVGRAEHLRRLTDISEEHIDESGA